VHGALISTKIAHFIGKNPIAEHFCLRVGPEVGGFCILCFETLDFDVNR
jgi:hypothetical protein